MKQLILIIGIVFLLLSAPNIQAQKFSGLDKSPMDVASYPSIHDDQNTQIKIIYSRPQLKERSLSDLVPNGKVWRTGANEATVIILYNDMKLGKTLIKAGTYSLATIPGEKEWVIILNTDVNVWGAYAYNETKDVVRLKVPISKGDESLEAFTIAFQESDDGVNVFLGWDTLRVVIPFKK